MRSAQNRTNIFRQHIIWIKHQMDKRRRPNIRRFNFAMRERSEMTGAGIRNAVTFRSIHIGLATMAELLPHHRCHLNRGKQNDYRNEIEMAWQSEIYMYMRVSCTAVVATLPIVHSLQNIGLRGRRLFFFFFLLPLSPPYLYMDGFVSRPTNTKMTMKEKYISEKVFACAISLSTFDRVRNAR